jgi:hypothetical protein
VGEDTNLIERDIRLSRTDLGRNLDELGDRARELVSWRSQYRDHSRLFLGAAFGAGLVFGLAALQRRTVVQAAYDDREFDVLGAETYAVGAPMPTPKMNGRANGHANGHAGTGTVARAKHELGETWGAIADGLVRTVSAKAVQALADLVPGFSEHVEGRYASRDRSSSIVDRPANGRSTI